MLNIVIVLLLLFLGRQLHKRIHSRWFRLVFLVPLFTITFFVVTSWRSSMTTTTDDVSLLDLVIEEATVEAGDLSVTVSATGAIQPLRQVPLAFQTSALVMASYVDDGAVVATGDLLAELDNSEMALMLVDATSAVELQRAAFDSLTSAPRDVDIAAAEAALEAARAQYSSALQTAPSQYDEEIARMQFELARNRRWQTQLQGAAIAEPTPLPSFNIPGEIDFNDSNVTAIETATGLTIPDPLTIPFLGDLTAPIGEFLSLTEAQSRALVEEQRRQIQNALVGLEYGVQIAETNYEGTLDRGPDFGALSAANAQQTRARIALERLLNGADALQTALANVDVSLSELTLDQARYNLEQTRLYAPFNGTVVQNNLVVGQLPPQGAALILMDTSEYYIDLPIDEVDIVKIAIGQPVEIQVDAFSGDVITGEVVRIAYTPISIGQVVTYTVRVRLNATQLPIRVGMTVTAQIVVSERNDILLVPNRFIRLDRTTGTASVVVRDADNTLREVRVLLGERSAIFSEITAGLLEGQQIVLLPRETDGLLN